MKAKRSLVQMLARTRGVKWGGGKLNWLVSLVRSKDIGYLVGLMVVLLFVGLLDEVCRDWGMCFPKTGAKGGEYFREVMINLKPHLISAFVHVFSPERAAERWLPMVLYFVAWLIGGGVLVSVLVGQYSKNKAGGFRRWHWLVWNHVVVLGWDDGILTDLKQAVSDGKHDCYIVTKQNVSELSQLLASAGVKKFYIYKGDYDNPAEWKENLNIREAFAVFIAGERDEPAHDARVRLLFDKVKDVCRGSVRGGERTESKEEGRDETGGGKCSPRTPKLQVNIHDFGLAQRLAANDPETYGNFHMNWAGALWDQLKMADGLGGFSLYVIGFGAMGKAVAISAIERFPPKAIYVSDDDKKKLNEEKVRFKTQFEHLKDRVEFIPEWSDALTRIKNSQDSPSVIVVAKKRSEKGLLCMMDIIAQLGSPEPDKTRLALDQEVDGYSVDSDIDLQLGNFTVKVFGMKKGCRMTLRTRAGQYRNPDAPALREYANWQGRALQLTCGIAGARYVLGGSLGYDAALRGRYDIDLRLLIPDAEKSQEDVHRQIDAVRDLLMVRGEGDSSFSTKFIDEGGTNYIWHTRQTVKVPGIPGNPDVELSWNIQAESTYRGIAEIAARLPQEVKDRYVVAKALARKESVDDYRALKRQWMAFVDWLIAHDAKKMGPAEFGQLLAQAAGAFSQFLAGDEDA